MSGAVGLVQKQLNRPIFDIHNPLDREQFRIAHEIEGIEVIECNYFMSTGFGVCNLNGMSSKNISWLAKKIMLSILTRASMLVWAIEDKFGKLPEKHFFSPYINCIVRKKVSIKGEIK